jgi:hypothetical protein
MTDIVRNKAGFPCIPITENLFIAGDGKMYRGDINDPDDCPRCKWLKSCPTGIGYHAIGTHQCNVGIFEKA